MKGKGLSFRDFHKRRGGSDFHHEKGDACKIGGGSFKKEGITLYLLTFSSGIFLNGWCVCLFCVFATFPSVLFAFHVKNALLLNLINRYDFCKRVIYKAKVLRKLNF